MSNSVFLAAIVGFILGWLLRWLVELFYRRRRPGTDINSRIRTLEASLSREEQARKDLQAHLHEQEDIVEGLRGQVDHSEKTIRDLTAQIEARDQTISRLETTLRERDAEVEGLKARFKKAGVWSDELETILKEMEQAASTSGAESESRPAGGERDDLKVIHGIGPVYEKRLNNGGIYTYEQLAAATPEQVEAIVDVPKWRYIDPESWIKEAKRLA